MDRTRSANALRWLLLCALMHLAGCALGPRSLEQDRLRYNEAIKVTSEQQLLLNIVRLRYSDTPSSLAVSAVALQTEAVRALQILPFFGVSGDPNGRGAAAILPSAQASIADRPTITLTPQDDQEFTRKLFTPMSLEGVLYLAKTTWPISTVFRLWLENLNWVSNAQSASGPTPVEAPEFDRFLDGVRALQALQDRALVVFAIEEREESVGLPMPALRVSARDVLDAAKEGYLYRAGGNDGEWVLNKKRLQPVLRIHPKAVDLPEMQRFGAAFRLNRDRSTYDISIEQLTPFPDQYLPDGVGILDLETRSLLQVLYFVSKGVQVPDAHLRGGVARQTLRAAGQPFDWGAVLAGLFRVQASAADAPPPQARVSVRYRDHWFYLDERDHDSLSTFSLLMEVARLELAGKVSAGPALTLPLGGR